MFPTSHYVRRAVVFVIAEGAMPARLEAARRAGNPGSLLLTDDILMSNRGALIYSNGYIIQW
jgi:hypothetical protein